MSKRRALLADQDSNSNVGNDIHNFWKQMILPEQKFIDWHLDAKNEAQKAEGMWVWISMYVKTISTFWNNSSIRIPLTGTKRMTFFNRNSSTTKKLWVENLMGEIKSLVTGKMSLKAEIRQKCWLIFAFPVYQNSDAASKIKDYSMEHSSTN